MMKIVTMLAVLAAATSSAHADWQYSRWGMTVDQVRKASKQKAKPINDPSLNSEDMRTRLVAPYQSGSLRFDARFMFDMSDRLKTIHLVLKDNSQCPSLVGKLSDTYGPPQSKSRTEIYDLNKWWDARSSNIVIYMGFKFGSGCSIYYKSPEKSGLEGGL